MSRSNHISKRETGLAIDSTGEIFTATVEDSKLVSLNIEATESTDFSLDVSPDNDTYFTDEETYTGSDIRDTFEITDRYLKIRVTTAASANATAEVTIQGVK